MDDQLAVPVESIDDNDLESVLEQVKAAFQHLNRAVAQRDHYRIQLDSCQEERDFMAVGWNIWFEVFV